MLSADDRRFLDRLGSPVPVGGCRLWSGARVTGDWGVFRVGSRVVYAHYFAWEREHGPVPGGMRPVATCGNHLCVEHLVLEPKRLLTEDAARSRRAKVHG